MLFSCEKEKTTPPQAEGEQAEAIVALNANEITRHSAKLWGQIDPSNCFEGRNSAFCFPQKRKLQRPISSDMLLMIWTRKTGFTS